MGINGQANAHGSVTDVLRILLNGQQAGISQQALAQIFRAQPAALNNFLVDRIVPRIMTRLDGVRLDPSRGDVQVTINKLISGATIAAHSYDPVKSGKFVEFIETQAWYALWAPMDALKANDDNPSLVPPGKNNYERVCSWVSRRMEEARGREVANAAERARVLMEEICLKSQTVAELQRKFQGIARPYWDSWLGRLREELPKALPEIYCDVPGTWLNVGNLPKKGQVLQKLMLGDAAHQTQAWRALVLQNKPIFQEIANVLQRAVERCYPSHLSEVLSGLSDEESRKLLSVAVRGLVQQYDPAGMGLLRDAKVRLPWFLFATPANLSESGIAAYITTCGESCPGKLEGEAAISTLSPDRQSIAREFLIEGWSIEQIAVRRKLEVDNARDLVFGTCKELFPKWVSYDSEKSFKRVRVEPAALSELKMPLAPTIQAPQARRSSSSVETDLRELLVTSDRKIANILNRIRVRLEQGNLKA